MKVSVTPCIASASPFGAITVDVEGISPEVAHRVVVLNNGLVGGVPDYEGSSLVEVHNADGRKTYDFRVICARHPAVVACLNRLSETATIPADELALMLQCMNMFWD